jgi:hypothetical protein
VPAANFSDRFPFGCQRVSRRVKMVLDERSRHRLFLRLEEVLGPERAETLMEMLPPVGWADVATKRDLDLAIDQLERRMDLRFEALEYKLMAALDGKIAAQTRTITFTILGSLLATTSLSFAAARFAG